MSDIVWTVSLLMVVIPMKSNCNRSVEDFKLARDRLVESERCMRIGGGIALNSQERILNQFLMKEKNRTIESSLVGNATDYIPARSFYLSKTWMESTPIFHIIKKMPKGAALHLHDLAITSLDWVVKNASYWNYVYMCVDRENLIHLAVFKSPPRNPGCMWRLLKTVRKISGGKPEFDIRLKANISLLSTDPLNSLPSQHEVWTRFNKYLKQVMGLLFYAPIKKDYFRRALEEFRADNVQYIEMKSLLAGCFELDGKMHDAEYGLKMFKDVTDQFVRDYPDFSGAKVIMSGTEIIKHVRVLDGIQLAMSLYKKYPDFFLGFDLAAEDNDNDSIMKNIDALLYPSQQIPPVHLPYFFSLVQTNWQGSDIDYNLASALLLNATRIGHGYGLMKHPKLLEMVKARKVAVEVNPLSSQMFGLFKDLRNLLITPLIANDIPIVINSDIPAALEALPLSHDMYVAFMTLTGKDADLAVLKQLAINSLQYSGMTTTEKNIALKLWHIKWETFVNDMIKTWGLSAEPDTEIRDVTCELTETAKVVGEATTATDDSQGAMLVITLCLMLSNTYIFL